MLQNKIGMSSYSMYVILFKLIYNLLIVIIFVKYLFILSSANNIAYSQKRIGWPPLLAAAPARAQHVPTVPRPPLTSAASGEPSRLHIATLSPRSNKGGFQSKHFTLKASFLLRIFNINGLRQRQPN